MTNYKSRIQLNPAGIAVDSSGNVYVGDFGENNRDNDGSLIAKWGTPGSGDGQFDEPTGLIVDPSGVVYVVDGGNTRIQVFAPT